MITIARFTTPEEAHLLRMHLSDRGIPAYLFDEHVVQLFWYLSGAMGGVRVVVPDEHSAEACAAWREYRETIGSLPLPENEVRAWPFVAVISIYLGLPFLLFGRIGRAEKPETEL